MPHDADPAVAGLAARSRDAVASRRIYRVRGLCSPSGFLNRGVHCVVLMIAGELLRDLSAALVFEYYKVAQEVEEAALVEHPLQQDLQLGEPRRRDLEALDRPPRLEPLTSRAN